MPTYTTQKAIRAAFWENNPNANRKPGGQNAQCTDTRVEFCDFVDMLRRDGAISEAMAQKVTL